MTPTTDGLTVRDFRLDDYDVLIDIWSDAGLPAKPAGRDSLADIARQLELPTSVYLVAELDGEVVGTVMGTHDGRKGWINRLAVRPDTQHQSIARELVRRVEARLNEQGIHIIACLVEGWNTQSVDVFKHLGYRPFDGIRYLTKRDSPDV